MARVPRSTIALLFVSILLPMMLFALAAGQNRRDVSRSAAHRVERTTRVLHEHALKVFETEQLMIDQLNERLRTFDWSDAEAVDDLRRRLGHLEALLPQVAEITIADDQGNVRITSRPGPLSLMPNIAGRDYFKTLRQQDPPLPVLSGEGAARARKQASFTIAARLKSPVAGRFDGVIAIAIDEAYFMNFYRDNERDYDHVVVLARDDGTVLASEPGRSDRHEMNAVIGHLGLGDAANVFNMRTDRFDDTRWLVGYERVGAYPVVVAFGITARSALAPWWRNMWGFGLVAALSSVALLGVSGFAIRRIMLEGRATMKWRRAAALLESEIAERARVEEQLRQAQKMEAVGRLTGGIAHDFNNLLTVVIGSLDLLSRRMKDGDPRHKALVANAVDGATRAATLTARLLAFSRQHPLDPKRIDVEALIAGMSNLLQRSLGETVTIECVFCADPWPSFADPNQLENAILNLCVNAVDAMPKGGVLLVETANATLDAAFCARSAGLIAGDYVMVRVKDTGTGMPPDVVARAFEPFFTTKPVGKGTGLGLSQVYGFARQSNGHATIQSEPGLGTTIDLYLPRFRAAATVAPSRSDAPSSVVDVAPPSHGTTILIVEDDDLVRTFSSGALRDAGYHVIEAGTGPEGLECLRQHADIALLFTDIVLKGPLNGRELADQVAISHPALPVLFTTGYTKDAIIHKGRLDEGVNFIGKPFTTADLTANIAALLPAPPPDVEPVVEARRAAE